MASQGQTFFCLFFARGCCARGQTCQFIHRVPLAADEGRADVMHDVFGRERHAAHRDDMGGVGSFQKNSRTLYVGQLKTTPYEDADGSGDSGGAQRLKKVVARHFGEFGEVEHVNVIWRLSIAFVRYRFRLNAEFAKEAMAGQSLDNEEILNIRWAYDDPNPMVQKAIQRANEDAMLAAMAAQKRVVALKDKANSEGKARTSGAKRLRDGGGSSAGVAASSSSGIETSDGSREGAASQPGLKKARR